MDRHRPPHIYGPSASVTNILQALSLLRYGLFLLSFYLIRQEKIYNLFSV